MKIDLLPKRRLPRLARDHPVLDPRLGRLRQALAGPRRARRRRRHSETVAQHPCVFATFTGPSFAPVHTHPQGRNGRILPCRPPANPGPAPTAASCVVGILTTTGTPASASRCALTATTTVTPSGGTLTRPNWHRTAVRVRLLFPAADGSSPPLDDPAGPDPRVLREASVISRSAARRGERLSQRMLARRLRGGGHRFPNEQLHRSCEYRAAPAATPRT